MKTHFLLCLSLLLLPSCPARADLEWDATEASVELTADDTSKKVEIGFRNPGPMPVTISRVSTGCGCTNAKTDKDAYRPGERGHLTAEFIRDARTGDFTTDVVVGTDAKPDPTKLTLRLKVEPEVEFEAKSVRWDRDDPRTPRKVRVAVLVAGSATLKELRVAGIPVAAEFVPVPGRNREFELLLTPPVGGGEFASRVILTLDLAGGRIRRTYVVMARGMASRS